MENALLASLESTVLGSVFLLLGLVWKGTNWPILIAGFDDDTTPSKRAVADRLGLFALCVGSATVGIGGVTTAVQGGLGWYGVGFAATVLLATLWLAARLHIGPGERLTLGDLLPVGS